MIRKTIDKLIDDLIDMILNSGRKEFTVSEATDLLKNSKRYRKRVPTRGTLHSTLCRRPEKVVKVTSYGDTEPVFRIVKP